MAELFDLFDHELERAGAAARDSFRRLFHLLQVVDATLDVRQLNVSRGLARFDCCLFIVHEFVKRK